MTLRVPIGALGWARLAFAASCVLAPSAAAISIGERPGELTPAALSFAGLVGTRSATLGILDISAASLEPAVRRKVLLLLATVDGIDVLTALLRANRIQRLAPALAAAPLGLWSVYLHTAAALEAPQSPEANDHKVVHRSSSSPPGMTVRPSPMRFGSFSQTPTRRHP
jgi:hypothetical protein